MKDITISLDEEVAQWVDVYAAQHHSSVSQLISDLLRQRMLVETDYESAMQQYLSITPRKLREAKNEPASSLMEAIREISRRCQALPDLDAHSADEILDYDERGLFR